MQNNELAARMTAKRAIEFLTPYRWECPHGANCEHCEAIAVLLDELNWHKEALAQDSEPIRVLVREQETERLRSDLDTVTRIASERNEAMYRLSDALDAMKAERDALREQLERWSRAEVVDGKIAIPVKLTRRTNGATE